MSGGYIAQKLVCALYQCNNYTAPAAAFVLSCAEKQKPPDAGFRLVIAPALLHRRANTS